MNKEELKNWLDRWNLIPSDGAKVLKIQKSKMSEYLSGDRKVPDYVSAHIDTFKYLSSTSAKKLIKERLIIVPNGNYNKS